jgi:dihydroflavonol-4-reductase
VPALKGVDAVFHCAASTTQSRWLRKEHRISNVVASMHVLSACRAARVDRLVHCSSAVTCGVPVDEELVTEDTQPAAGLAGVPDGYAASKRMAEIVMLAAEGIDVVVVNPGFMFGPFDVKPSSGRLILSAARGSPIGWPTGCNNFVDARDVANGMIVALERGRAGERYIFWGGNLTYGAVLGLPQKRSAPLRPGSVFHGPWQDWLAGSAMPLNFSAAGHSM